MLRDIYLHGRLGREHGRHWRLDVASPIEAVRALTVLRPPLRAGLRAGQWRIVVGRPTLANAIEPELLAMRAGSQPIHIVPATQPRGGDTGKIIGGVVLVGAAIALSPFTAGASFGAAMAATSALGVSFGSVALLGASMVFAGVAGLLTQPPPVQQGQQATDLARPEDRPSFLFNGITNNTQQGGPVPIVMGLHLVGSVVVSAGLNAEDIAV